MKLTKGVIVKLFILIIALAALMTFFISKKAEARQGTYLTYSIFENSGKKSAWSEEVKSGKKIDTSGYISAFKLNINDSSGQVLGGVKYSALLSLDKSLSEVENGAVAGITDIDKSPIKAIKAELTGEVANTYDIYTRVLENEKWSSWVKNGSIAGNKDGDSYIKGIEFALYKKDDGNAPKAVEETTAVAINNIPNEPEGMKNNIDENVSESTSGADESESAAIGSKQESEAPAETEESNAEESNAQVRDIDSSKPMVALTFDDGPNASVTRRILAALDANNAKATFFVVGSRLNDNKSVLRDVVASGHEIGNHTFEHKYLPKQSVADRTEAIVSTNNLVTELAGVTPKFVRPPGGLHNEEVDNLLSSLGMSNILWSIDTEDWKSKNRDSVVSAVLDHVKDGDIVLMHDLYTSTAEAAEIIIPELVNRGYELVTVSELANARGGMEPGKVYRSFRNQ